MNPPLLPSFRLCDVDYAILNFYVARLDVEQLVDSHPGAPQHAQHEIVSLATLLRRGKYVINLFFFQIVGNIFH